MILNIYAWMKEQGRAVHVKEIRAAMAMSDIALRPYLSRLVDGGSVEREMIGRFRPKPKIGWWQATNIEPKDVAPRRENMVRHTEFHKSTKRRKAADPDREIYPPAPPGTDAALELQRQMAAWVSLNAEAA